MSKNYNLTLQTNNSSLEEIIVSLNNMPKENGGILELQEKTVNPTINGQTVIADDGYDGLGTVTVNAMPIVEQATPTISVDSSTGLITATTTQTEGYVEGGTKIATKQLAFQAATTVIPGTASQIAVYADTYVGGDVTVQGDANLVASNIISGKSIFGISGTAGGERDTSAEDELITRTITMYANDSMSFIGACAFYGCSNLTAVSFPVCTNIEDYAFYNCTSLTDVSLPACTSIGSSAFYACKNLTSVSLPVCISIGACAFSGCTSFNTIYLMASQVCNLAGSNVFEFTSITSTAGSIFVPASLVDAYKSATNWTYFSNQIFGV